MKSACHLLLILLAGINAQAADIPTGTYALGELAEAKAEARERKKAVAFLVSVPDSKYRNTQQATSLAVKELRSYAVVVFVVSKQDKEVDLPPPVVTGLRGPSMGTFDPRIVLMSADLRQTLATVGSEEIVGDPARETYRRLRKSIRAKLGEAGAGGTGDAELIWVRKDGRHYRGRFIEVKDGRLHVESEKFGKGSLSLEELSPGSLSYAKLLAGKVEGAVPDGAGDGIESWTSSDGKVIEARFVKLQGETLTVETAAGKSYSFPLGRLEAKSQARAKQLASSFD